MDSYTKMCVHTIKAYFKQQIRRHIEVRSRCCEEIIYQYRCRTFVSDRTKKGCFTFILVKKKQWLFTLYVAFYSNELLCIFGFYVVLKH